MLAQLIEEFTAALSWSRAARSYLAASHDRPRAFARVLCPNC